MRARLDSGEVSRRVDTCQTRISFAELLYDILLERFLPTYRDLEAAGQNLNRVTRFPSC